MFVQKKLLLVFAGENRAQILNFALCILVFFGPDKLQAWVARLVLLGNSRGIRALIKLFVQTYLTLQRMHFTETASSLKMLHLMLDHLRIQIARRPLLSVVLVSGDVRQLRPLLRRLSKAKASEQTQGAEQAEAKNC